NQGEKTNIKVTLKDTDGNILKGKKISLTINKRTYTATTNNKGIAVFKVAGLKGGNHKFSVKFQGDSNYNSLVVSKIQKVVSKTDLALVSIKKVKSSNKQNPKYKVTIINKGSLKSKPTTLSIFHIRKGIKIKAKNFKVKSIAPGKKISLIVDYYPDRTKHRYCIAYYTLDPKNKNKEIIYTNNKKSISLKH
ncbi:Ig-like domain-containing protein, partial [Methanobrevibacter sp. TMH8]|uniref:Ig-like domain-containing protein n=1 Tax=Methanobrevibacter sp. TMH8 TaxID=2848611 RepID=UPI001CCDB113